MAPGVRGVALTVVVILLAPTQPTSMNCNGPRWKACYDALKQALDQNRPDDALSAADDLLRAKHTQESAAKLITGVSYSEYYVHYQRARALMLLERLDEALNEAESSAHPDAARLRDEIIDQEPPRIEKVEARIVETDLVERAGVEIERVSIELEGTVFDKRGIEKIVVGGQQFAPGPRNETGSFPFRQELVLDEPGSSFLVAVEDKAHKVTEVLVELNLPPLDLGPAAKSIYAVLVGVDRYDTEPWLTNGQCGVELHKSCAGPLACYPIQDLGAASNDAERFARLLRSRGVPAENITLLMSRVGSVNATQSSVRAALAKVGQLTGTTVIFFFAGHGVHSRGENLLLLSDTRGWQCEDGSYHGKKDLHGTAISVANVEGLLKRSKFDRRYVLLDACRTSLDGTRGAKSNVPGFDLRGVKVVGNKWISDDPTDPVVFYASKERAPSVEWKSKDSGYFTWFLLQALRRDLNLRQLEEYVQTEVRNQTKKDLCAEQTPECLDIQVPVVVWPKDMAEDLLLQQQTSVLK